MSLALSLSAGWLGLALLVGLPLGRLLQHAGTAADDPRTPVTPSIAASPVSLTSSTTVV